MWNLVLNTSLRRFFIAMLAAVHCYHVQTVRVIPRVVLWCQIAYCLLQNCRVVAWDKDAVVQAYHSPASCFYLFWVFIMFSWINSISTMMMVVVVVEIVAILYSGYEHSFFVIIYISIWNLATYQPFSELSVIFMAANFWSRAVWNK